MEKNNLAEFDPEKGNVHVRTMVETAENDAVLARALIDAYRQLAPGRFMGDVVEPDAFTTKRDAHLAIMER